MSRLGRGFSNLVKVDRCFYFSPEFLESISSYLPIVVIDVCNDGGLLKKILKYGVVEEGNPKDPDVVLGIHVDVSNIFNISLHDSI